MVPFVLAGVWTLVALGRQVLLTAAIGTTRVEVSQHPFYPGGTYQGFVSQTGRLHVRWFQVQLVCEEQAIYQQGTDTRRATQRVYRATAFSQRKFDITPQQAFEATFEFTVPAGAMHSFVSTHNAVMWTLVVRGRMARWGEFERRFPVYVYPAWTAPPAQFGAGSNRQPSRGDEESPWPRSLSTTDARCADRPLSARRSAHRPVHGRRHAAVGGPRGRALGPVVHGRQGDEDMAVHHFERLVDEPTRPLDLRVPRRFATFLPASPLSYDGQIVKVCWCVRVRLFLPQGQESSAEAAVPARQRGKGSRGDDRESRTGCGERNAVRPWTPNEQE